MSLLKELKRRNVIRVAVAYIVAAWLLLQITDVLMSVLGLPEFVGKAVFLVLVIGFIPAMVFSWAYEITPEGVKRDAEVMPEDSTSHHTARKLDTAVIAMLVAVAGLVLYDRFVPAVPNDERGAVPTTREAEPADSRPPETSAHESGATADNGEPKVAVPGNDVSDLVSLAVLPFANMSPDPDNEFFADGISEELLNVLVDVEGLRVPSRTSSFAFKGQNLDIRDIAAQLQVGHVLEGSVRKAGNQVRITAQLIDVSTDTHLWSETYDRELEDIFAIQDEIASSIVRSLGDVLEIEGREEKPTDNLEAYTLYLQGRHLFQQREAGLAEAERLLRQAVELDPDFAEAWGTLATTCVNLPNYLRADRKTSSQCAEDAAQRALALKPDLAEAKLALANLAGSRGDRVTALQLGEEVTRVHPGNSLARLWYGVELNQAGYLEEALAQFEAAAALDPSYGLMLDWLARGYLVNGQLDRVVEPAIRAVELGRLAAGVPIMYRFVAEGSLDELEPYAHLFDEASWEQAQWLIRVRDDRDLLDEALAAVEARRDEVPPRISDYHTMGVIMTGGSSVEAFEEIRRIRAFDDTIGIIVWIPSNHRHLGSEPMKAWARDQGFLRVWRERGWPDLCHPVGDDDFQCEP